MIRWQAFYESDPRIPDAPPSKLSEKAAQHFVRHGHRRILDLGCGAGREAMPLSEAGLTVVGVDLAAFGLELARREECAGRGPWWVRADARRLPFFASSFDGIYSFGLLHEFTWEAWRSDINLCMRETHRVLKDKGCMILAVLAGESEAGLPHVRLFSREMLTESLRGFRCLSIDLYSDTGCTGSSDYRIWAVICQKENFPSA